MAGAAAPDPVEEARAGARDERQEAAAVAQALFDEADAWLRRELQTRPLVVLGAAFGVGCVLGRALPASVTALLGGLAGRAAMGVAASRLAGLAADPGGGADG